MQFKKVMLGLGVGVLAALFIGFLIEAIYAAPKYEEYCNYQFETMPMIAKTGIICNSSNYQYNETARNQCYQDKGMVREHYDSNGCVISETCDYCDRDFQKKTEQYNRNLFYITAPIGLLMILLGLYLPAFIDAIAGGMLFGGILTMMQVTMRVFGNLSKWPRVILLGLELALVIWIGIKKVHEEVSRKPKRKKKR